MRFGDVVSFALYAVVGFVVFSVAVIVLADPVGSLLKVGRWACYAGIGWFLFQGNWFLVVLCGMGAVALYVLKLFNDDRRGVGGD